MKIAVNACIINDRPSGARSRFLGLYRELFRLAPHHDFQILEPVDACIKKYFEDFPSLQTLKTPLHSERSFQRLLRGRFFWKNYFKSESPHLFETSYFPSVRSPVGSSLLTVHDIRYLRLPGFYSKVRGLCAEPIIRRGLRSADLIITVSEAMKKEILEFEPKAKIEVIANGISTELKPIPSELDIEKVIKKYKLHKNFLLSIGHLEKRKNYVSLIQAFSFLKKRGYAGDLCIIGASVDAEKEVREKIRELNLESQVRILSGIPEADVSALFCASDLFIFPSLYEGFGIPILEAMHFNKAFVVSDLPVFKEITDGRAVYFDPLQPEMMAQKIENVLASAEIQNRLKALGKERLPFYQYSKIAADYLKVLERFQA